MSKEKCITCGELLYDRNAKAIYCKSCARAHVRAYNIKYGRYYRRIKKEELNKS